MGASFITAGRSSFRVSFRWTLIRLAPMLPVEIFRKDGCMSDKSASFCLRGSIFATSFSLQAGHVFAGFKHGSHVLGKKR